MRGRPAGEVSRALMGAAAAGPATVRELAERACVGYGAARYTASRMVSRGELVILSPTERPVVLGLEAGGAADVPAAPAASATLRSFWEEAGAAFAALVQASSSSDDED